MAALNQSKNGRNDPLYLKLFSSFSPSIDVH